MTVRALEPDEISDVIKRFQGLGPGALSYAYYHAVDTCKDMVYPQNPMIGLNVPDMRNKVFETMRQILLDGVGNEELIGRCHFCDNTYCVCPEPFND